MKLILLLLLLQLNVYNIYSQPGRYATIVLSYDYSNLATNSSELIENFEIHIFDDCIDYRYQFDRRPGDYNNNSPIENYILIVDGSATVEADTTKTLHKIQFFKKDVRKTMNLYVYGRLASLLSQTHDLRINGIQFFEGDYLLYVVNKIEKRDLSIPEKNVIEIAYKSIRTKGGASNEDSSINIENLITMPVSNELIKSLESRQVSHGVITIETFDSCKFEVFPHFGCIEYVSEKKGYVFEHMTDKSLVKKDRKIDSLNNIKIIHKDGWVNFQYHKNRLYSSLIVKGLDSMLVYVFTGAGDTEIDSLLKNRHIIIENILFENIDFEKGTALINIYKDDLGKLSPTYIDSLPIAANNKQMYKTLVINNELIISNMISEEVLTIDKLESTLKNPSNSQLPKEYKVIFDCFRR